MRDRRRQLDHVNAQLPRHVVKGKSFGAEQRDQSPREDRVLAVSIIPRQSVERALTCTCRVHNERSLRRFTLQWRKATAACPRRSHLVRDKRIIAAGVEDHQRDLRVATSQVQQDFCDAQALALDLFLAAELDVGDVAGE
jgi:hypothetical protein